MFKVGETHYTNGGYTARILCTDANYKNGAITCDIVALLEVPTGIAASGRVVYFYAANGKLSGTGHPKYDLLSNEPDAEEASLITDILSMASDDKDVEQKMLKIIRQLRKK